MTFLARVFGWLLSLAMGWAIAGILLLSGATIMARYIVAQIATLPEKPAYANEDLTPDTAIAQLPAGSRTLPVRTAPQPSPAPQNQTPQNQAPQNQIPPTQPTAQLASATTPPAQPVLPEGAYQARVTYPRGLVVRSAPSRRGDRVTGVYKQQTVVILGSSEDGQWQRVQLTTGQEGWVIGGYTVPLDEAIDGTAIAR
ncbi:MAG: SH3 domain-containing protein [Cyanophyceae cyanobacterium]